MTSATSAQEPVEHAQGIPNVSCDHCGLPVPIALFEADAAHQFCCGGCAVAYEVIHGAGLDEYYAVRQRVVSSAQPSQGIGSTYLAYDSSVFLDRHTHTTEGGLRAAEFRLGGVHCAACVWLVEKLPKIVPGVVESRLSLGSARARVVWDPERVSLSCVARQLDRLGYSPQPIRDSANRQVHDADNRRRLVRVAVAGALAGNNMLIALALYAGVFDGIETQFATLFRWLSLGLGWISLLWPGATFFRSAITGLRAGVPNLDQPIAGALAVGAVAGTANVLLARGDIYFDSLSVLVFLLLVGRYLQAMQQRWAHEAVGLMLSMTPDTCRVVRGAELVEEPIEALACDDVFEVRPGELFPADGVVISGRSAIDQSILTGESTPHTVDRGDTVCAAAQNLAATLRVKTSAVGAETRVGKLTQLVEDGLSTKPAIVRFADRVAGWFIVIVSALAALNLTWWGTTTGLAGAVDSTVALLIVACPCALGLATPLTMAVAIGKGSQRGMLIKSATALEQLARISPKNPGHLLLDKTGTLTRAVLRMEQWHGPIELQSWVAAIESESNHPVAKALVARLGPVSAEQTDSLFDRTEVHGSGVRARTPLGLMLVGSPRFARESGVFIAADKVTLIDHGRAQGYLVAVVALDNHVHAVIWLSDTLQANCRRDIARLIEGGWCPTILSGDASQPVQMVAQAVGIEPTQAHGELSPEEKLAHVRRCVSVPEGERGVVAMVGDGVNDAAALAAADVGIAVQGGAEVSLAAADVYLNEPGIGKLVELVELAEETMRVARRNLGLSLGYNLVAVTLAIAGLITPLVAAILMPISSATVLASAATFSTTKRSASSLQREPS
ncbi:Copper-exporting P-type ATPase A [Botrimarina hoheduenensis]|uniref:Copper-exporting P-type ATPase A n=1 Tax=Botrimarina hoheduenensis TaxID=2528000 RepID=A0A5C5VTH0_9BACT|nr:Copper-exporting P-type ATPase A [Botrimarina hoheduenensis]